MDTEWVMRPMIDTMVNDALWDAFNDYHMGITAENVAEQWGLTREQLDEFAAASQQKCLRKQSKQENSKMRLFL